MPSEPWYYNSSQALYAGELSGLCATCRRINFGWLLCHDLAATVRKSDIQQTTTRRSTHELPFGSLMDLVGRARDCHFCRLIIASFESAYPAFVALEQFGKPEVADPMVESPLRQRAIVNGREIFTSFRQVGDGIVEFRVRWGNPTIESLDPGKAYFELENVDKGYQTRTQRYSLRVWLCSAQVGQKIASLDFHRVFDKDVPYQGRRVGSRMDFALVKAWVERLASLEKEGTACLPSIIQENFMLVDTVEECIVQVSDPCRYIALSYVWGGANTLLNEKKSIADLKKPGGVSLSNANLPRTIHDAMCLVLAVGLRYLWVDSLCIIQDDYEYQMLQINNMDSIYRSATFTIVAASGNSANAGLPGVREETRSWVQHVEVVRKMILASRPRVPDYASLPWSSRAWTLQEEALSTRKLYVLPETVRLHHERGVFEEDLHPWPISKSPPKGPSSVLVCNMNTNFGHYATLVSNYTNRAMTKNSDVINAFTGIMSLIRPLFRGNFLFGLPITELDQSLLWLPATRVKRRIDPNTNQKICPSWTWAGWEGGQIVYDRPGAEHLSRVSWINARTGTPFTTHDVRGIQELHRNTWLHLQSRGPDHVPVNVVPTSTHQSIAPLVKGWSIHYTGKEIQVPRHNTFSRPLFVDSTSPVTIFEHPISDESGPKNPYGSPSTFLQNRTHMLSFMALTAKFKLRDVRVRLSDFGRAKNTYQGVQTFGLEDRYGNFSGAVGLHDDFYLDASNEPYEPVELVVICRTNGPHYTEVVGEYPPEDDNDADEAAQMIRQNREEDKAFPVIAKYIENALDTYSIISKGIPENWESRPFQCYDFDKPWCLYDVLVVRHHGVHTYRTGIGRCHVDAFWRQEPIRRMISLC